ncbi:MAG: sigma-54-dependent Fis family transcriptional regulator [Candidatus Aminicenantes bacterium]|nr:sigma-54-dependent Fis family transcriptional regulator [Candidatus Aminicenantes bacterium]MBM3312812.1 sigma-54-dependent Fis family transcriptional regulator [Candidatus Aminicenantes bacterium]
MKEAPALLLIDDDPAVRDSCGQVLSRAGYRVTTASTGEEGLERFGAGPFFAVLLDLKLPGMGGLDVMRRIKDASPETPVIIITGYASIESAVAAVKQGAFDYLAKPFTPDELRLAVRRALEGRKRQIETLYLRRELEAEDTSDMVTGRSRAMARLMDIVRRVSPTDSTVLIIGESGTGKELLAREIHRHSLRREAAFVVVDCGALVESLFESELFGHVKGSFTGAHETKHGRFESANGGTIFLDEIGHISLNIQAKLLRVIQEREVTRIGGSRPIKVDVRILAATNVNLEDLVRKGTFREDLFYRLSVVPVHIPPLRDRKEDIPFLVDHFLCKFNRRAKRNVTSISPRALKALQDFDWPGNIRELENTIERAVVLSKKDNLGPEHLIYYGVSTGLPRTGPDGGGGVRPLEEMEKEHIRSALLAHLGNRTRTAEALGIDRKTLWAKIKKYGLEGYLGKYSP